MALTPQTPPNTDTRADKLAKREAAEQDVLLREVDDAVRQDRMAEVAHNYGTPIIAAVVVLLAAFGGYIYWQHRQEAAMEQRSEQLTAALDSVEGGNLKAGDSALQPLVDKGDGTSRAAARMLRAGILLEQDKAAQAVKLFSLVAADDAAPAAYRDLAKIRMVATQFDNLPPERVIAQLKPLAVPGNAFFGSAGELVGMAYLKQGRTDLAGPLFAAIAKDDTVPDSLRSRARQLAGLLGVDAIVDVDKAAGVGAGGAAAAPPAAAAPAP